MSGQPEKIVVTQALIREVMHDARLKTHQKAISLPVVQRFVDYLVEGKLLESYKDYIQVDGDRIVDGNHRYIAGRIFGIETPTRAGRLADRDRDAPILDWQAVIIDDTDWGNK